LSGTVADFSSRFRHLLFGNRTGSNQRNYIAPHVRQVVAETDFAMLVRGEDRFGHFQHVPSPAGDLTDDAIAWRRHILTAQNEALYDGAEAQ
jgi:hypothetical protein